MNTAHIILLLISPDFLASEYCYSKEMTQALKRHNEGNTVVIIPIILRPVDLRRAPFNKIQLLPTDAKPVTKWMNQDDAFLSMIHSIEDVIQKRFLQSQTLQKTKEQWFDEGTLHYESKHYEEALVALEQVALLPIFTKASPFKNFSVMTRPLRQRNKLFFLILPTLVTTVTKEAHLDPLNVSEQPSLLVKAPNACSFFPSIVVRGPECVLHSLHREAQNRMKMYVKT